MAPKDESLSHDERRRFFRIDDDVAVHFTLLSDEYGGEDMEYETMDVNQEYQMNLEVQIRQAMASVRAKSPKLALVLDLLNQKINLLRASEHLEHSQPVRKKANISACGIAFSWHENMEVGQQIMLYLYLQPRHELIRTPAHIAGADENPDEETRQQEPYILRIDFDDIHHSLQEVLIQHVVQRQAFQLRKKLDED